MAENVYEMLRFIKESPTCFQAVENAENRLKEAGYVALCEKEEWKIEQGGKYYVNRNGSSLIAFQLPANAVRGFHMIASHSDSPCFKIKESPEIMVEDQYLKLNVEKYGGMIMSTWLDRPLSVAGRLVLKDFRSKTVAVNRDLMVIPNVAIHMSRDMNKGIEYNAQTDMLPLFAGADGKALFWKVIAEAAGTAEEEIAAGDLFLYSREEGRVFGAREEFICSPRLDDLECVYTSLQAMLETKPKDYANVLIIFDNEEVGSVTKQGAASTFLQSTLSRICEALQLTQGAYAGLLADSFMISADNAHAVHPNHPEKADPTNRPYLNGGIVIKYHGGQKYTTDALSAAVMKELCRKAEVPYQTYANRSDIAGGSTLGNISAAQVAVSTVDIGFPQLAMHSVYETAGRYDVDYMIKAMKCFYEE